MALETQQDACLKGCGIIASMSDLIWYEEGQEDEFSEIASAKSGQDW